MVAARLRLFDLAQRAYAEALDLDPAIGDAQHDVGIVRFERRRWAQALEELADEASLPVPPEAEGPYPTPFPRAYPAPDRPDPQLPGEHDSASWAARSAVDLPRGGVLDLSEESAGVLRRGVRYIAAGTLLAGVTAAVMTLASSGISRAWAGMIGLFILAGVAVWLRRALTEPLAGVLSRLRAADRALAGAIYLSFAAPLLLPVYAAMGGVVPLVAGMILAAVAQLLAATRR